MEISKFYSDQEIEKKKKIRTVIFYIQQEISNILRSDDSLTGSNWKFIPNYKLWLEQVSVWFGEFNIYCNGGKEPKRFPEFMMELHKFNEREIIEYTRKTWKGLVVFVQSLGIDSMEFTFASLIVYFDVEQEYARDFE